MNFWRRLDFEALMLLLIPILMVWLTLVTALAARKVAEENNDGQSPEHWKEDPMIPWTPAAP